jgi:hypothetical protein
MLLTKKLQKELQAEEGSAHSCGSVTSELRCCFLMCFAMIAHRQSADTLKAHLYGYNFASEVIGISGIPSFRLCEIFR